MAKLLMQRSPIINSWKCYLYSPLSTSALSRKEIKDGIAPNNEESESEVKFPEAPVSCCMSGCSNCVWISYAEEIANLYKDGGDRARAVINKEVTDPCLKSFLLMELKYKL